MGGGPNDLLLTSNTYNTFFDQNQENEGIFIWLFIDPYMNRLICGSECYNPKNAGQVHFLKTASNCFLKSLINQSCMWKIKAKKLLVIYNSSIQTKLLIDEAQAAGLEVINFSKLKAVRNDIVYALLGAGHPTPEAYWLLTEVLTDFIEKMKSN